MFVCFHSLNVQRVQKKEIQNLLVTSSCHCITESSVTLKGLWMVWVDARINSIKRIPHESQCSCQLFVNLYVNQGPLGSERATLSKETEAVGIDQISILQKLDNDPCEADNNRQETRFYRWEFYEDCSFTAKK